MPHVVVKMKAGRTEEMKQRLTEKLTEAVTSALGVEQGKVSIAIQDIAPDRWTPDVYETEIQPQMDRLYRKPGY